MTRSLSNTGRSQITATRTSKTAVDMSHSIQNICAGCQGVGGSACRACLLVVYCGRECQVSHWPVHKLDCRSDLRKHSWQPRWLLQNRRPSFIGQGPPTMSFGKKKYLWGNVPALDIVRLSENEGERYEKPLNLLFAASGDLRNVVKTVASLPGTYEQRITLVLNDLDLDIVARNLVLILVVFTSEDVSQAIDCMIHVWYSALITEDHEALLSNIIRPMIDEVNQKIQAKKPGSLQAKTWKFGTSTVRLVLSKEGWAALPAYLSTRPGLSDRRAHDIRTAVTMAAEREDYVHRSWITTRPEFRLCLHRFREDGMLLPFGHSRKAYIKPNLTMFQGEDWPMMDSADPLSGWSFSEVSSASIGPAANDIYGKLYHHVKSLLARFYWRVLDTTVGFQLFNVDAAELSTHTKTLSFARIETANIADGYYLGIAKTLFYLGGLLQPPSENRHAVLSTLFINAVEEMHARDQRGVTQDTGTELKRVLKYLPLQSLPQSEGDPNTILMMAAMSIVRDGDKYFSRYMKVLDFPMTERMTDMKMRTTNTTIEKWPMRLKLRPGQLGADQEFRLLLASSHTGTERYVEWVRATG